MASTHTAPKRRFHQFGDTGTEIIQQASLKSSSELGDIGTPSGGDAAGITHDSEKGTLIGSRLGSILVFQPDATQHAALMRAGCMTIWVEQDFLTDAYTAGGGIDSETLFSAFTAASNRWLSIEEENNKLTPRIKLKGVTTVEQRGYGVDPYGKDDFVRVDLSWVGSQATMYVDYFPIASITMIPFESDQFTNIYAGGRFNVGGMQIHYIRDFIVSTQPIILSTHRLLTRMVGIGHSFDNLGDYPSVINNASPGTPFQGDAEIGDAHDSRVSATIHRELHKIGITPGNGWIKNTAIGGSVMSTISDHLTAATEGVLIHYVSETATFAVGATLTGAISGATGVIDTLNDNGSYGSLLLTSVTGEFTPGEVVTDNDASPGSATSTDIFLNSSSLSCAIITMGTNDINAAVAETWLATSAQWEIDFQAELDLVIVAGAEIIILPECVTLESRIAERTEPERAFVRLAVTEVNKILANLAAANSEVHVAEVFDLFGGFGDAPFPLMGGTQDDAQNNVHPNNEGYQLIGKQIAKKLISILRS